MYAGMKESVGDYTVIIDADLQQDPAYVLRMMQILDEDDNLDSVAAFQEKRREGKILRGFKSAFYHMINRVSQVEFVDGASDFRLLKIIGFQREFFPGSDFIHIIWLMMFRIV